MESQDVQIKTRKFAAGAGGIPETIPDVPLAVVFLLIFMTSAAWNMSRLILNKKRLGYKFAASGAMFGFSMARITTMILRLAWSQHHFNTGLAIASVVFNNAGVIVLDVLVLVFAFRLFEQYHRPIAALRPVRLAYRIYAFTMGANLILLVVSAVQSYEAVDEDVMTIDGEIRKFSTVYTLVYIVVGASLALAAAILPSRTTPEPGYVGSSQNHRPVAAPASGERNSSDTLTDHATGDAEKGRPANDGARSSLLGLENVDVQRGPPALKAGIIMLMATFLIVEQSVKVAQVFTPPTQALGKAIFSEAAFWCLSFLMEVFALGAAVVGNVPRRFGYIR